jgi:hypothetical protein
MSLGKPSSYVPFMMPKRIAETPADKQISEYIGSGPFIFKADQFRILQMCLCIEFRCVTDVAAFNIADDLKPQIVGFGKKRIICFNSFPEVFFKISNVIFLLVLGFDPLEALRKRYINIDNTDFLIEPSPDIVFTDKDINTNYKGVSIVSPGILKTVLRHLLIMILKQDGRRKIRMESMRWLISEGVYSSGMPNRKPGGREQHTKPSIRY